MNKVSIGISVALFIVCLILAWRLKVTVEDLAVAEVTLKTQEVTIKEKEAEIKINNETMANLQHERDALMQERITANATIQELMSRSENCAWGKEELPADVQSFLEHIGTEEVAE